MEERVSGTNTVCPHLAPTRLSGECKGPSHLNVHRLPSITGPLSPVTMETRGSLPARLLHRFAKRFGYRCPVDAVYGLPRQYGPSCGKWSERLEAPNNTTLQGRQWVMAVANTCESGQHTIKKGLSSRAAQTRTGGSACPAAELCTFQTPKSARKTGCQGLDDTLNPATHWGLVHSWNRLSNRTDNATVRCKQACLLAVVSFGNVFVINEQFTMTFMLFNVFATAFYAG